MDRERGEPESGPERLEPDRERAPAGDRAAALVTKPPEPEQQ
jgi:hypothetical protein